LCGEDAGVTTADPRTGVPKDRLLALVKQILGTNAITRSVSIDDLLTDIGLTSIDMVNLMLAIEAEFNIMLPASEITAENFRSISTIEGLIVKLVFSVNRP
jgi:acyl carrier protein